MQTNANQPGTPLIPFTVTAVIAVLGTAVWLFAVFGPGSKPEVTGSIGMISATSVSQAGATITPSRPAAPLAAAMPSPAKN